MTEIAVRPISAAEHLDFIRQRSSASFLQTPAWGAVKSEWRSESVGWFAGPEPVGVGLILYRQLPKVRRYLAYVPEGPVLDWASPDLGRLLAGLAAHVRTRGAFALRMGPPVRFRSWNAETVKQAIADPTISRLSDMTADETYDDGASVARALQASSWRRQANGEGFSAGQPPFVFQLDLGGRSADDVLAGMNQLWRRNIKKAAKAGVTVREGGATDLAGFHALYVETARRDAFTPRPLAYFEHMFSTLRAEDPDRIRLYLAHHDGDLVAATTWVRVGRHAWYSYGASSTVKREVRGSNAIQWQMIKDSIDAGAEIYDLRGITDTVAADDPHLGLIQFKVGTGGRAVEYVGEWDLPLNRLMYFAFSAYLRRRGAS